uniref:Iron-sulfur cluster assembly enzyme ISCU n=1 Tax=Accipiter nisus TaxID=211598 RepID=A0A8B9RVZ3_9AVES
MAALRAAGAALLRPGRGEAAIRLGYHKKVVDHYENPRNVGSLDRNAKNVGTGLVGAPACGDVMKLQVEVDENGRIVDARFKTFGCGSAIASSSLATEWVKGKTVDEALKIKNTDIAKELCLPPVKLHCSKQAKCGCCCGLSLARQLWQYLSSAPPCVPAAGPRHGPCLLPPSCSEECALLPRNGPAVSRIKKKYKIRETSDLMSTLGQHQLLVLVRAP